VTLVCTDGKVMAADSLQLRGEYFVVSRTRQKLFRMPDGSVVGMAGDASVIAAVRKWLLDGEDYDATPAYPRADPDRMMKGLRLYPDGRCELFDSLLVPFDTELPAAIGSADEMAVALMGAGLAPAATVTQCMRWCVYIGGKVRTMKPTKRKT
jgi:hypothetical protein